MEKTISHCARCGRYRYDGDLAVPECPSGKGHDWELVAVACAKGDKAAAAASAGPARLPPDGAQAALDQVHLEVRRVALKAGVQPEDLDASLKDFARELVPHAGRRPSIHRPSHWRGWFRGWAAGRASKP